MTYKKRKNLILTDCDGVLLNWEYAFCIWMEQHGYEEIEDGHHHYSIQDRFQLTKVQTKQVVRQFNESAAIGFLPPLRDAMHYIKLMHENHGFVFHVITSLSKDANSHKLREMNLGKLFGDTVFERFIYLDTGADKDEALAEYQDSGLIWIEDKTSNAELGHSLGLNSFLMEHGHNMHHEGPCTLVKNWEDVYERVTD